ncbi:MAG TPA: ORF6N domain-containing protein [Opitutaceae bacterium]
MPAKSSKSSSAIALVTNEHIDRRVLLVRGQKVLLDSDLAELYGVETRALVQAVKRNEERFPEDFMFQLDAREWGHLLKSQSVISSEESEGRRHLKSQSVTAKSTGTHGGRRTPPYAFTEQGVAMLSSVLRSPRAIAVNVEIMRAFVRLREMIASHADLARKLNTLEKKYDKQFKAVFEAIRELMAPVEEDEEEPREMGFHTTLAKPAKDAGVD